MFVHFANRKVNMLSFIEHFSLFGLIVLCVLYALLLGLLVTSIVTWSKGVYRMCAGRTHSVRYEGMSNIALAMAGIFASAGFSIAFTVVGLILATKTAPTPVVVWLSIAVAISFAASILLYIKWSLRAKFANSAEASMTVNNK